MRQTTKFVALLLVLVVALGVYTMRTGKRENYMDYKENLDLAVAIVDGDEILLRELAFYIAYEEGMIEKYATIYDAQDTGAFWRIASNQTVIRVESKEAVMDMAVHDFILYELARAGGVTLGEEEERLVEGAQTDFWSDLDEEQKEALGVEREEIDESIRRVALAEKYQTILAEVQGVKYEEFSFNGEAYKRMLEEHEFEIYEDVWNKVNFGGITVDH